MKAILRFILILIFLGISYITMAQKGPCVLKDTMVMVDFGNAAKPQNMSLSGLKHYKREYGNCPNDGNYAFASYVGDCFDGRWVSINQDHTAGDKEGKMMIINGSERASAFFSLAINGLLPGTTYELAAWMVNICKYTDGCRETSPDITIVLETAGGKSFAKFNAGKLIPARVALWNRYQFFFTTPGEAGPVVVKLLDNAKSGCGNDFALDDISIIKCTYPEPVKKDPPPQVLPVSKPVEKTVPPVIKPTRKEDPPIVRVEKKEAVPVINNKPDEQIPVITRSATPILPAMAILPEPLRARENRLVKQLTTSQATMQVELYDNAQVDGDTVSVYHNNELIIDHAGLSDKAIRFTVQVDASHPHHELVMVANNLGSIPPNTSLMIITAKNKRYEIFISSDEGKNAKVVIDLEQ